jgi:hypothetical protein
LYLSNAKKTRSPTFSTKSSTLPAAGPAEDCVPADCDETDGDVELAAAPLPVVEAESSGPVAQAATSSKAATAPANFPSSNLIRIE